MSDGDYNVLASAPAQQRPMQRTPSWPEGALRRVATFQRVQQAMGESIGTFTDALPIIAVQLAEYVILAWTTTVIGKAFGDVALAGTSLGFMTFNLGFSIQRSFILGLDTQAPQAYGAGRLADVGLACQRACTCALFFACIVGPGMWFLEPALLAIGQPPETVTYAMLYLRCLSLSLPVHAFIDSGARFLWAQERLWPPFAAAVAGLAAQAVWVRLVGAEYGYSGAAMAPMVAYSTMLATLLGCIFYFRPYEPATWPGLDISRAVFGTKGGGRQFKAFLKLSVACAFGESSEWWWWETVGLHVGTFGPTAAATHAIGYTLVPLLIMVPNSIGICMCNVIGRQLGGGDVKAAKKTAALALGFGTAVALAYTAVVLAAGSAIGEFFTSDAEVLKAREGIWPWVCLFLVLDAEFGMLAGLNRSLGIQDWSARCVWVCLWVVGTAITFGLGSDLGRMWNLLPLIYGLFDLALLACALWADWGKIAAGAKMASAPQGGSERSAPLLP